MANTTEVGQNNLKNLQSKSKKNYGCEKNGIRHNRNNNRNGQIHRPNSSKKNYGEIEESREEFQKEKEEIMSLSISQNFFSFYFNGGYP